MANVTSFYHVKGVLERLNDYYDDDEDFDSIDNCIYEGKITPAEVARLFELAESAMSVLPVLSDVLEYHIDSMAR